MINYHETMVEELNKILPTYYEMILHKGIKTPCISYMELDNSDDATGDTIGYSNIIYQVKVWSNKLDELQRYALEIDRALRLLGFSRSSSSEIYDNQSTMIQKVMTFNKLMKEEY